MTNVDTAKQLATDAHKDQKRWDGSPYIMHPQMVSELVDNDDEKIVAWLHDVLEDCPSFDPCLIDQFGAKVVYAVHLMTKTTGQSYTEYLVNIKNDPLARAVKLADLKHNISDLHKYTGKHKLKEKYEASILYLSY